MMVDRNEFFSQATLRICGSLHPWGFAPVVPTSRQALAVEASEILKG